LTNHYIETDFNVWFVASFDLINNKQHIDQCKWDFYVWLLQMQTHPKGSVKSSTLLFVLLLEWYKHVISFRSTLHFSILKINNASISMMSLFLHYFYA